uniref:Uncharacterized protein n=1 Tax=Anguilla anguilla TaxID=7936 RepID=A0A0E9TLW2_ANGAN
MKLDCALTVKTTTLALGQFNHKVAI